MDHLEFAAIESAGLVPTAWEKFVDACEEKCSDFLHKDHAGKPSFDGDDEVEGYSMDMLWSEFHNGKTPQDLYDWFYHKVEKYPNHGEF